MTTPTTRSTCTRCGGAILPGDRFCGTCGTPVAAAALSPAPFAVAGTAMGSIAASVHLPADRSPWEVIAARLQAATLGEFEILTELGRGGMAAVYLARDLSLNRPVAIKVMAPGLLLGAAMVERFRQEAVTVANLQHAHIVSIHAVRQVEDLHFFVMQFVPGRTVEGVIREHGALPVAVTLAWLFQVGSALGYAHRRGVIHRDVKPGNILLNIDGEAVVTDFGIAKVTENPALTQTGAVVGTPLYMSPEQCYAKELTGASDQYSLGIVAYEMLAGRAPFSGSSFALMRAHTDDPPPPLQDVRSDVPPSVEAALMRMLAKRPEQRFATMAEALASLGAGPLSPADPLHTTLQDLAAATERLESLRDVLRTPASPIPKTRERPKAHVETPRTPVPATEALTITIAPPPTDLEPGATETLRATVKTASGTPAQQYTIAWESSDPAVASIDPRTGRLTASAAGRAVVTASAGPVRDTTEIVVDEPKAAHIEISMPADRLAVGGTITLSAAVTNRFGVRVQHHIEWSLDRLGVATIVRDPAKPEASSVALRGVAEGTTGIYASCGGVVTRVSLNVIPAPVAAPPPAPVAEAPPAPSPRVATPGAAGQATPRAPVESKPPVSRPPEQDVQRSTAQSVEQRPDKPPAPSAPPPKVPSAAPPASATAVVSSIPADAVDPETGVGRSPIGNVAGTASPPTPVAPSAGTGATTAGAPSAGAAPVTSRPAASIRPGAPPQPVAAPKRGRWRWAAAVVLLAMIGTVGYLVTLPRSSPPLQPADTAVLRDTAQTGGASVPAIVPQVDSSSVARAPDSSIAASPPVAPPAPSPSAATQTPANPVARRIQLRASRTDAILPGQTMSIDATVRDASGAPMRGAPVRWTSSDPSVATVDAATGTVRGIAQGTARISARSGSVSEGLTVAVSAPPPDPTVVTSVQLAEIPTMTVGESVRLSASAQNALGSAATGATIQWTSSNPDVASVGAAGLLTARGPGSATIQASSGDRSAERRVTVRAREAPAPKADSPAAPPPKTEAELAAEVRAVLGRYTRGIETRDTALMRSAYPSAPGDLLRNWQATFEDARDAIRLRGGAVELLDPASDAIGTQVRARGQYTAAFYSKANRRETQLNAAFTAVVQRTALGWRIVGIR